ncbi:MAG: beta-aspartyl-peptidase [Chloroflexi bacterium]|nr:beta-aspartyl-peptidase [Chloroflexota bacterium]
MSWPPAGLRPRGALLLKGAEVYAPEAAGRHDLFMAAGQILAMEPELDRLHGWPDLVVRDVSGLTAIPGLVDGHLHLLGGGGEGGPPTRNPEARLADIVAFGVTTAIGCLGMDCLTRHLDALLAHARALEAEGLSTYILSGGYAVPTPTLTGDPGSDLVYIERVIGVGEVAISDRRSSQPTCAELAHLAAGVYRGGLLAGKPAPLVLHVGDALAGLAPLRELVRSTGIPFARFLPTHVNRSPGLLEEASRYRQDGGWIDLTAGVAPSYGFPTSVEPSRALAQLAASPEGLARVTVSSDANGSAIFRDDAGSITAVTQQRVSHLWQQVRAAIIDEGVPLSVAISTVTANAAALFGLPHKGRIAVGADADVILLDDQLAIRNVYARGRELVHDAEVVERGVFES